MCSVLQGGFLSQNKGGPETSKDQELGSLVDKYLDLADRATGFRRHLTANNRITVSTCIRCQRIAAALDPRLLAFIETLHVCPGNTSSAAGSGRPPGSL